MRLINIYLFTLTLLMGQILGNRYVDLVKTRSNRKQGATNPYGDNGVIYNGQCGVSGNFFLQVILPFTDPDFRIFTHKNNRFISPKGWHPLIFLREWRKTAMSEKYDLVKFLGSGGYGIVMSMCDKQTDRCFAMKMEEMKDFYQYDDMMWISQVLDTQLLAEIFDLEKTRRWIFSSMRLADLDLNKVIAYNKANDFQRLNIINDLLTSLYDFLRHKIVHGDIKAGNILIKIDEEIYPDIRENMFVEKILKRDSELVPILADVDGYGVVVKANGEQYDKDVYRNGGDIDLTDLVELDHKMISQTPKYRAQETWLSYKFGPAIDIYSMGLTIYDLFYNTLPEVLLDMTPVCKEIRGSDQKEVKKQECLRLSQELETSFDAKIESSKDYEKCVLVLVQQMVRSDPLQRILPLQGRKEFMGCLADNGIGSVSIEEFTNEDGTRFRQIKDSLNLNAYKNIK